MTLPDQSIPAGVKPHPRPPRWLTDIVLSALIVAIAFMPPPVAEFVPTGPVAWVLMMLPVLILPWRKRWPLPVLAVLLVLFGAAAFAGTLSPGIGIAMAVAMFHVATVSTRRTGLIIGCLAVIASMLLSLPISLGSVFDPRALQFGLFVAFAAAAGDGARSRRAYIAAITERADRAERTRDAEAQRRVTEERLRIARDLHDAVAHQIAVISLNAGVATQAFDTQPEKAKQSLSTIREAARTVLREIGDLMNMLRTTDNTDPDTASPQRGLDHLGDLLAQFSDAGLEVQVRTEGDINRVTGTVGLVAYRVLQEALTNAHKHGTDGRGHILLTISEDELTITVTNPMKPQTEADGDVMRISSGAGLVGLRERVASARGTLDAAPAPGGWRTAARLPLSREEAR